MSDTLAFKLDLISQAPDCLRFRLLMRNTTRVKILAPRPAIYGLHFGNLTTGKPAAWSVKPLESARWVGYFFESGDVKQTEYLVRPTSIAPEAVDEKSEYARCSVDLIPGSYLVWIKMQVDQDYFCSDSNYRYPDLVWLALQEQAVVWTGQTMSNRFNIAYP
ncbi:MAG: hypothetical protein HY290_21095 [Planctomycetia bacterium]|nr:hypothetical protein [Planctomycetia bacterium]